MFGMGPMELAVIGLMAVLIFGPRQLPKLGRAAGDTIKQMRGLGKEIEAGQDEDDET